MARLGDTVIYRNKDGIDIVAIVTQLQDDGSAFLTRLPPPSASGDPTTVSYPIVQDASENPAPMTWRERDDQGA